jgi:hypothetical protein
MDAGAHGGQVVCELATALRVLKAWGATSPEAALPCELGPISSSAYDEQPQPGHSSDFMLGLVQVSPGGSSIPDSGKQAAAAGPSTAMPTAHRSPFHQPPARQVSEAVEVRRLGIFRFKGAANVELVQVGAVGLADPADIPLLVWQWHSCGIVLQDLPAIATCTPSLEHKLRLCLHHSTN